MGKEKTFTVKGTSDQLLQYVRLQLENDIELPFSDHLDKAKAENCLYQAFTDALIRYNEGIHSGLASQETIVQTSSDNVKWVSSDGVHSISFSGAFKGMMKGLISAVPAFFFGWLTGEEFVFVSTFLQAMISSVLDNSYELTENEPYVYALCLDFTKHTDNKYFSVEDLYTHNERASVDLVKLKQFDVKVIQRDEIETACLSLCENKLLRHSGTRYKIIW